MKKSFFMALALTLVSMTMSAQCYTKSQQDAWLQKAEACKPVLNKTIHHPLREVKIVADANAFQGFKAVEDGSNRQRLLRRPHCTTSGERQINEKVHTKH